MESNKQPSMSMKTIEEVRNDLVVAATDPRYQKFTASLIPGVNNILGVRLPELRRMAARLGKIQGFTSFYLEQNPCVYFEENMLQGMLLGSSFRLKGNSIKETNHRASDIYQEQQEQEFWRLLRLFVPRIDNWSVCDSFCAGLRPAIKKQLPAIWDFILPYFKSSKPYELRFAVVMSLDYFIDEQHLPSLFALYRQIKSNERMVKMAIAWAWSVAYVRFPDETYTYLKDLVANEETDIEVVRLACQKIRDSLRVSPEQKARLMELWL